MPTVNVGDAELYYEVSGRGPPLFLVPGLGGVGAYWRPQLAEFGKHFTVIVHDHRGTGRSTRSRIDYSVDQMTDDLVALMDHLDIEAADIVGHSTGGAIGQTLALVAPERVRRLVLFSSWTRSDEFMRRVFETRKTLLRTAGAEAYVQATAFFLYPDWWINDNAALLAKADAAAVADFPSIDIAVSRCDAVLDFDREAELGRIRAPTLVFCAKDDFLTPYYFSERLAALIPGAELRTIPRGGHACSQTMPEAFNAAILSFLRAGSESLKAADTQTTVSLAGGPA